MPNLITEFALTSGKIIKVPSVKKDSEGKEKVSNYYQIETVNKAGDKNGYGSFHQDIAQALKVADKIVPGCLVAVTIQVYEKPEEVSIETKTKHTF